MIKRSYTFFNIIERSEIRLTISPVVFPFGFFSLWFDHFNHFCSFWFACVCHCWPSVQPLQLLTWDTCYFHYLVPTPMSPSSQSVSPPSETGSQESIDAGTVGRYEICMGICYLYTKLLYILYRQSLIHLEILLYSLIYGCIWGSVLMQEFSNWILQMF